MNYNLKNKAVAVIALAFVFTLTLNHASFAADENAAAASENIASAPVPANPVDGLIQPVASATENAIETADKAIDTAAVAVDNAEKAVNAAGDAANKAVEAVDNAVQNVPAEVKEAAAEAVQDAAQIAPQAEPVAVQPKSDDEGLDFLNEQSPEDFLNNNELMGDMPKTAAQPAEDSGLKLMDLPGDEDLQNNPLNDEELDKGFDELNELEPALPDADAPKSPLEKFGNAILSKVDNNLFNQMSHIEKEATLLQLEKKREELRTKVLEERQKSLAIIEATRRAKLQIEEERKKAEAERQAKILEEQRKLKEKEMELEKLRQGKVINDYMNEMLMMNQQWVEKSAKLQGRIKQLEDERIDLIETFKTKITDIDKEIEKTKKHAVLVVSEHQKVVDEFNKKIADLEGTINDLNRELRDSLQRIKEIQEAASNPFNEDEDTPNKNDVDMSQQYAIMDITGKGDDIVAKIINREGKMFIVHKGSMLKNGEVVTSITDHYISFENKGVKSYLYTGNTVMEYEPEATFGGTSELLSAASDNEETLSDALEEMSAADKKAMRKAKKQEKEKQTKPKKDSSAPTVNKSQRNANRSNNKSAKGSGSPSSPHVSAPSFSRGMFVK